MLKSLTISLILNQLILNLDILDNCKNFLESEDESTLKETIYIISNITAGTVSQINKVCKSGILYKIIDIAESRIGANIDSFYDEYIIRDSFWSLLNAITGGIVEVKTYLMDYKINILDLLIVGLIYFNYSNKSTNYKIINEILIVLKQFIWYEKEMLLDENAISNRFKDNQELINLVEKLTSHLNESIVCSATELLDAIDNINEYELNELKYKQNNQDNDVEMEVFDEDEDFKCII